MNTTPVKPFNKFREGLGFAIIMSLTYLVMDLINAEKITFGFFIKSFLVATLAGAVAGFLYAWIMGLYFKRRKKRGDN